MPGFHCDTRLPSGGEKVTVFSEGKKALTYTRFHIATKALFYKNIKIKDKEDKKRFFF